MALAPDDLATDVGRGPSAEAVGGRVVEARAAFAATGSRGPDADVDLVERIAAASGEERTDLMVAFVRDHVTRVLRLGSGRVVDRRHRLMDLGLDSLMAVELRNRLGNGLGLQRTLPATLMFDYPTIEAIAHFLERELETSTIGITQAAAPIGDLAPSTAAAVAALSEDEVEAMLLRKLESL
jgi:hypothetical protein